MWQHWDADSSKPFATTQSMDRRLISASFVQRESRCQAIVVSGLGARVWDCAASSACAPRARDYALGALVDMGVAAPRGYRIAFLRGDGVTSVQVCTLHDGSVA